VLNKLLYCIVGLQDKDLLKILCEKQKNVRNKSKIGLHILKCISNTNYIMHYKCSKYEFEIFGNVFQHCFGAIVKNGNSQEVQIC